MKLDMIIALIALLVTVIGNIIAITRFSTKQEVTLASVQSSFTEFKENMHESIKDLKSNVETSIKELKEDVNERINSNQTATATHLAKLEEKQDKHNNLIERMVIVEQSSKSAHKRIDELDSFQHDCLFKKGNE